MERFLTTTDDRPALHPPGWDVRIAGALFLGWILLARVGPMLAVAPSIRAWYPPAALVAGACVLWGARALIPIVLAATAVNTVWYAGAIPLWRILLLSAAIKVIYWLCARRLTARGFDLGFSRPIDVARFAGAFAVAAALAAILAVVDARGLASLARPEGPRMLLTFWVGDVVAVVALAPAFIVAASAAALVRRDGLRTRLARVRAALTLDVVGRALSVPIALVVADAISPSVGFFAYALCFLPIGWIAFAHGPRVAAIANFALSFGAVWSVHSATAGAPRSLELQIFIGMLALTGLVVGSVADERRRAFALLEESTQRYRQLVELLPDPLVVHRDGKIIFANRAAASVLGASSPEALRDVVLADMATARSRGMVEARLRALAAGSGVPLVHHTLNRLDGAGIVEVESVSIPFAYQGTPAALTVARDVTQRVRLEEELRHAQRMEAVGRLAGGVAHDFNNLLTVIISYSDLLAVQLADDTKLSRDVQEIRLAAERAGALTRQLLSFSRRQVLQPTPLELNDVVRGTDGLLRRLVTPDIEVVSRLDPAAGTVFADRGQIEQVIINLVVNARDAMPSGGVLTLETALVQAADHPAAERADPDAEHFACIVVRDTGTGMDDATMRRIFDPFFTTKEVGRGTGLGLSTVHGIVEQSGGAVTVKSRLGDGSEFRVFLPVFGGVPSAHTRTAAEPGGAVSVPPG